MAGTKKANKDLNELKALIKQVKDSGVLPHGYAKKIAAKLNLGEGVKGTQKVYQIANGISYDEQIADEILSMAKENKMKQQIALAKDILG